MQKGEKIKQKRMSVRIFILPDHGTGGGGGVISGHRVTEEEETLES
jgi:hypothetical protein